MAHRFDDRLGVHARAADLELVALGGVDVDERHDRPVDLVLESLVGADAQRVPAPLVVAHLPLDRRHAVDDVVQQVAQVGAVDVRRSCVIGRPTSAGIRLSTFSAAGVKRRIRRSSPTITIAICTLASRFTRSLLTRVSSSLRAWSSSLSVFELLVGRLQLLLGGLQLLVGRLQLLVAREDLLVRRLQLLVGGLHLLDDRLQVFARRGQLLLELRDAPAARRRLRARPPPRGRSPLRAAAWNSTTKCSAGTPVRGITSRSRLVQPSSERTRRSSLRTGLRDLRAACSAPRRPCSRPSRASFSRLRLASPGAGSRKAPVLPRNWTISSSALTTTPGGLNRSSMTRLASLCTSRTSPRGSLAATVSAGLRGGS